MPKAVILSISSAWISVLVIVLSIGGLLVGSPILLLLLVLGLFNTGSPLFRQARVRLHQNPFKLIKFRTMQQDTASVATHLTDPNAITSFSRFLRRTKLDELPQLWNVLIGDMSLVGLRPCLFNQHEFMNGLQEEFPMLVHISLA
jgi:O-antigen biosynthesis protein WbqP